MSSSLSSLSAAAVLDLGLLRWALEKGEEVLRRMRGFVDFGMVVFLVDITWSEVCKASLPCETEEF